MSTSVYHPYSPPAPYQSWFSRNWKWFVPVLVVAFLMLFGVFALLLLSFATGLMRSTDAYTTAIQRAEHSPEVAAKIGHPLRVGRIISGHVNLTGASGEADLSIPISGEHGSGHIIVSAKKKAGQWTFQTLEVHVDGGDTVIPLMGAGDEGPADDSV